MRLRHRDFTGPFTAHAVPAGGMYSRQEVNRYMPVVRDAAGEVVSDVPLCMAHARALRCAREMADEFNGRLKG